MIPGKIQMWGSDVHVDWADRKKVRQQKFAAVATARINRVPQPSHFHMNNSRRGFYQNCGYLPIGSISNHSRMPLMNNPPVFPNTMPMMNTRSGSSGMYQHLRSSYHSNPNNQPVYQNSGSLNHPANNPARSPFINFNAQPFPSGHSSRLLTTVPEPRQNQFQQQAHTHFNFDFNSSLSSSFNQ
jgi:hypothetical protein